MKKVFIICFCFLIAGYALYGAENQGIKLMGKKKPHIHLHELAKNCNADLIHSYFERYVEADVNEKDNAGFTPLHWASINRNPEAAQALLSQPACNVNAVDNKGNTALHCAADYGSKEVIQVILSQPNCEVNAADKKGSTALHCAARWGHQEAALILLAYGADANKANKNGKNSLDCAVANDHHELEVLMSRFQQFMSGLNASWSSLYVALHARCGSRSAANIINGHIMREICSYLHPRLTDYSYEMFLRYVVIERCSVINRKKNNSNKSV